MSVLLLIAAGVTGLLAALRGYGKINKAVHKVPAARLLPKAIGTIVVTAQFSELIKVVEHATIVHIAAALLLLAVMLASKAGTEGEELI